MADYRELEYAAATGNDYALHQHTYRAFVTLIKVGVAVVAITLLLMAYFLT
jgi:aa3 type cytochrome c oxidase subunit IV